MCIRDRGSDVIKFYMGSDASYQAGVNLPSNVTNLITLARNDPSYEQVLNMPFRHFIMWAYPFGNSDEWWGSGYKMCIRDRYVVVPRTIAGVVNTNINLVPPFTIEAWVLPNATSSEIGRASCRERV